MLKGYILAFETQECKRLYYRAESAEVQVQPIFPWVIKPKQL